MSGWKSRISRLYKHDDRLQIKRPSVEVTYIFADLVYTSNNCDGAWWRTGDIMLLRNSIGRIDKVLQGSFLLGWTLFCRMILADLQMRCETAVQISNFATVSMLHLYFAHNGESPSCFPHLCKIDWQIRLLQDEGYFPRTNSPTGSFVERGSIEYSTFKEV